MNFEQKIAAMQSAQADAEQEFLAAVLAARDVYVLAGQRHIEVETAWMNAPADQAAADAAAVTWAELNEARDALMTTVTSATTVRAEALRTAWAQIKTES
jgi:hypothetical protein